MARQPKVPQPVRHRCDWTTDEQLVGLIESLSGLLHEALVEQRDRAERRRRDDAQAERAKLAAWNANAGAAQDVS